MSAVIHQSFSHCSHEIISLVLLSIPAFQPMSLRRQLDPFDHPDWLFELKLDGFRSLAEFRDGTCRLISRNGNIFKSFGALAEDLHAPLEVNYGVLDGEIVCVDRHGRPRFNDLLFRRREPLFYAFDFLYCDGEDLRFLPLDERKHRLRAFTSRCRSTRLHYVDHIEASGIALFRRICKLDIEGIVAKQRYSPYVSEPERTTWLKIKNPRYSQMVGRDELFGRDRHREPVAGWHTCDLACDGVDG